MLLAYPLIRFLYSSAYLPSAHGLQILIWDIPFLMYSSFCGNITTVVNKEHAAARIYGINAAVNIVLNLILVPHYGLVAAAAVTVITDLIGTIQFHFLLRKKLNLPDMKPLILRIGTAAALMGIAVKLVENFSLPLLFIVSCIIYIVLILAFRVVDRTESEHTG